MITPLSDQDQIRSILSIDNMYDSISYDDSPKLREYNPAGAWFALRDSNSKHNEGTLIAGFVHLQQLNNMTWIPHIFIREQFRGKDSIKWGKEVIEFMGSGQKYLAITPYKSAKKYAEKLGFKNIGVLTKSIKKNGKIMDQYMLELET